MSKLARTLSMMATLCLLLIACGGAGSGTEGKTVVVTPAIKGNSASLNVGDELEIQIPTIPTEGFEWVAQELDTNILVQEGEAVYAEDTDPNSAGGITTLVFKAIGPGQTSLKLFYASPSMDPELSFSKDTLGVVVEVK